MSEEWRDIEGFENLYQVSNKGNVRSLGRTILTNRNGTPYYKSYPAKLKKLSKDSDGYYQTTLSIDGKNKTYKVHRLVAQVFVPNPNDLPMINHKDEDKTNNCVENLEWCDAKYNSNYGTATMRRANKRSKKVMMLKDGNVIAIYPSLAEMSRLTGFSAGEVSQCCNGKLEQGYGYTWKYA